MENKLADHLLRRVRHDLNHSSAISISLHFQMTPLPETTWFRHALLYGFGTLPLVGEALLLWLSVFGS